jgi:MFS transporter, AAHS family, 4-hydroxybenzoate transporter
MAQASAIDVGALINSRKVGRGQIAVVLWCILLFLADGYDFGALGNIAPSIIADWHTGRAEFGIVFGIGVIGLMVGSLFFGALADRLGRKPVIIMSAFIFGFFTFISAWSVNPAELALLRLLASLGIGGVNGNVIAYVADHVPERRRALAITVSLIGFTGGISLGSFIIAHILRAYDWHMVLYVGGALPIIVAFLLIAFLPESVMVLALHPDKGPKVAALLSRYFPDTQFSPQARYYVTDAKPLGFSVFALFRKEYIAGTCVLWFGGIMNGIVIFFLGSWLPTLVHQSGIPISDAVMANSLNQAGGIIGALIVSPMLDRFGPIAIVVTFVLAAPVLASVGFAGGSEQSFMLLSFAVGIVVVGAQFGQSALQGVIYPTAIRSTGASWAIGIQRFGAIIGPVAAGFLIERNVPLPQLFAIAAIPELLAACGWLAFTLSRRGAGKTWSMQAATADQTSTTT